MARKTYEIELDQPDCDAEYTNIATKNNIEIEFVRHGDGETETPIVRLTGDHLDLDNMVSDLGFDAEDFGDGTIRVIE